MRGDCATRTGGGSTFPIGVSDDGWKTHQWAQWVARDLVAVPLSVVPHPSESRLTLVVAEAFGAAGMRGTQVAMAHLGEDGSVQQMDAVQLAVRRRPELATGHAWFAVDVPASTVPSLVQCALAVCGLPPPGVGKEGDEAVMYTTTGVQLAGVLDDVLAYEGPLGVSMESRGNAVKIMLWAPTAQRVVVHRYPREAVEGMCSGGRHVDVDLLPSTAHPMSRGTGREAGVWQLEGLDRGEWEDAYYRYEVDVYTPSTSSMETVVAPDPYSRALCTDGVLTQVADVGAADLLPRGWDVQRVAPLRAKTDVVLYELHVRDFSISDDLVPEDLRGTFGAFCVAGTHGRRHLEALQAAGLTHVALLPCYDFGSVPEARADQKVPDPNGLRAATRAPASPAPQAAVAAVEEVDAYNWGYDPVVYGVPDGSYCVEPCGKGRSLEYRRMIQALHRDVGVRVVADVVYNHTYRLGPQDRHSVLDKLVPGYYHRLEADGSVCGSVCGTNTACENRMMSRLVVDDLLHWATAYHVDGFRFDLMGHLMLDTLLEAKEKLEALTLERDGVDGSQIYLYGEGWEFGEISHGRRGKTGCQRYLGGTGIGAFNDRFRQAMMGGNPFGDPSDQGLATGNLTNPNEACTSGHVDRECLGDAADVAEDVQRTYHLWLRASMAASLRKFPLAVGPGPGPYYDVASATATTSTSLRTLTAGEMSAGNDLGVGWTERPEEAVNYVACHDNETLWDQIAWKLPQRATIDERVAVNNLAVSLVAFSQGVPFFHAGDELLRSKSLDRDSYSSGDHFNRLDFSMETGNNWGAGLPVAAKNQHRWPRMAELLKRADVGRAGSVQMRRSRDHLVRCLKVRKSTRLLRLHTARDILSRVKFLPYDPADQGMLVMAIDGRDLIEDDGAKAPSALLVSANFAPTPLQVRLPQGGDDPTGGVLALPPNGEWALHPELQADADLAGGKAALSATGVLTLPPTSVAVFIRTDGSDAASGPAHTGNY